MKIRLSSPLSLREIARATGGLLNSKDTVVEYIVTDSREATAGELFIAIKGDSFDGEDFVSELKKRGVYSLSTQSDEASIAVSSTTDALLLLAKYYKNEKLKSIKHSVAITGSVGKTTAKDVTMHLLSKSYKAHATEGNKNNTIGAPLTILSAPSDTEILILELGMNSQGEIYRMTKVLNPDIAVITNVGHAHIGKLGTRELIAKAKLEVCESESDKLVTLIPYGEPLLESARGRLTVSLDNRNSDIFLFPLLKREDYSIFDLYFKDCILTAERIEIGGRHVLSALAYAIGIARLCGMSTKEISNGIKSLSPEILRQRFITVGKFKIYDDTYSSSPEAVNAIISYLSLMHGVEKSAMLGDMLELGAATERLHRKIGADIYRNGFSKLYAYGVYAPFTAAGAMSAGMKSENIFINTDVLSPEITANQIKDSYNGELIMFKASHALNASKIYDFLK